MEISKTKQLCLLSFHSFVEFLDENSFGLSQIRNAVRQNILRLVLYSLQHPSPNLAHFLMGYELRKPVSKTNLQDPGKFKSRAPQGLKIDRAW